MHTSYRGEGSRLKNHFSCIGVRNFLPADVMSFSYFFLFCFAICFRYLELYEKVHFFGEDPDQRRNDCPDELPGQRKKVSQVSTVPMRYNHYQHQLSGK